MERAERLCVDNTGQRLPGTTVSHTTSVTTVATAGKMPMNCTIQIPPVDVSFSHRHCQGSLVETVVAEASEGAKRGPSLAPVAAAVLFLGVCPMMH